MPFAWCRVGLVWSAVFAAIIVVVPRYMELERESVSSASAGVPASPRLQVLEGTIASHATLVSTLVDSDISAETANDIASLVRPVFDVRRMHVGNSFRIEKELDGDLKAFEYKIDDERLLKVIKARDGGSGYDARVETVDLDTRTEVVHADIQSSLFGSLDNLPKGDILAEGLAGIFAWDLDFNVDIQKGAEIRLIVDKQFHDGTFVKYGPIQAALLVNGGKTYHAYRFNNEYYDAQGNTLKRAFLSSPLKVMRITSGFTYRRMHPILGIARAHLAVDYGAPEGTTVFAVANGTVISAGPNGDLGNFVEIRHANGMTTGYGHLSRIAPGIVKGSVIRQDEVIGNVGQTGLATGPHLHFMMTRGGKPVNPRSMKTEPAAPIDAKLRPQFLAHIASLQLPSK